MHYDVIIIGAGPAGIFAALELVRRDGLRVLVVERGPDIDRRSCPARTTGVCAGCSPCDITCGCQGHLQLGHVHSEALRSSYQI